MKALLDTHVFIWLMQGIDELSQQSIQQIESYTADKSLFISMISLWEIAMLEAKGRLSLSMPCLQWVQKSLSAPGLGLIDLTPEIVVESANLPGDFHGDPADRLIIATTRLTQAHLITRDEKILNYGHQGYVDCIKV